MVRTKTRGASHGQSYLPSTSTSNPAKSKSKSNSVPGTSATNEDGYNILTSGEIKQFKKNLRGREVHPTKFYDRESIRKLQIDPFIDLLFQRIGWLDHLSLSARTYKDPTLEFLSTYARDDSRDVLTFRLQGHRYALAYETIDELMGTSSNPNSMTANSANYRTHLLYPNTEFWRQITSLPTCTLSRQRDHWIVHPVWRIAHRILSTGVFGRFEVGQINRTELYFLQAMAQANPPHIRFTTFFLDKCDDVRNRTKGEICIGGFVTLLGESLGLSFPRPQYIPVDEIPPSTQASRLDCNALVRMKVMRPLDAFTYYWLDHEHDPIFYIPSDQVSAFQWDDPETWLPVEYLVHDGDDDNDEDDDEDGGDEDDDDDEDGEDLGGGPEMNAFEPEDHFDMPAGMSHEYHTHQHFQPTGAHYDPSGAGSSHQQSQYQHHYEPIPPFQPPQYQQGGLEGFFTQFSNMFRDYGARVDSQFQQVHDRLDTQFGQVHTRLDDLQRDISLIPSQPNWENQWTSPVQDPPADQNPPMQQYYRRKRRQPPSGDHPQ